MLKITQIISIVRYGGLYEVFFTYTLDGFKKYGIVATTKKLDFIVARPEELLNFAIQEVTDFKAVWKRYTVNTEYRDIRSNDGTIVMTDDSTFLYCHGAKEILDSVIKVNFGTARTPDIEDIEVVRGDPIIGIYGNNSLFEFYAINSEMTLVYSSLKGKIC